MWQHIFYSTKLKLFASIYGNSCAHMLMLYMEEIYKEATILHAAVNFFKEGIFPKKNKST